MKSSLRISLQVLSFALLAALSIYLAPKYSNPFKYHFEVGQPWAYGLVTAESNFAIYKTDAQLAIEQKQILRDYAPCYVLDTVSMHDHLYVLPLSEMDRLRSLGCSKVSVLHNRVAIQIPVANLYTPKTAYEKTHKNIVPNLQYDSITSENMRQNLLSSISLTEGVVQAVIADCPFSSATDIITKVTIENNYPIKLLKIFLPVSAKLLGGFDINASSAKEAVKNAKVPILLIHGDEDDFVPYYMSETIKANNPDIEFHTFKCNIHGLSYIFDTPKYKQIVTDFMNKHLN